MSGELADDAVNAGIAEGESHVITELDLAKTKARMDYVRSSIAPWPLTHRLPDWSELPVHIREKVYEQVCANLRRENIEPRARVRELEDAITEAGIALDYHSPSERSAMGILGKVMDHPTVLKRQGI
jgi:hypothetical protein